MKTFLRLCSLLLLAFAAPACKKDRSCENCPPDAPLPGATANKPPVARAGMDQVIKLPADSTLLDGSASSDPDGRVVAYGWRQITGPNTSLMAGADLAATVVRALVPGRYAFELKVTDDGGLSAYDTVAVDVQVDAGINQPPIARAGGDLSITLPINRVRLDGSGSSDPDHNITAYQWTKVAGPTILHMASPAGAQTEVSGLVEGIYLFELKVTDGGGLTGTDTVQVTVAMAVSIACDNSNRPRVSARLVPLGTLTHAGIGSAVASAGGKILFAGGYTTSLSSRVDIYDIAAHSWSTAELSQARYAIAAIASGTKIFFAGGEISDGTLPVSTVDIYDAATNTWTATSLSWAGHSIAAASVGDEVFFAGGDGGFTGGGRGNKVDIYNVAEGEWYTSHLSTERRVGISAVTANNKMYFAGGEAWNSSNWYASSRLDIYDANGGWTNTDLKEGKIGCGAIAWGNKIYWAGGHTGAYPAIRSSCLVEIMDVQSGRSATATLSKPASWMRAVVKDNKILFFRPYGSDTNIFDIYEPATDTWSVGVLPHFMEGVAIIAVNNVVYLAGGNIDNRPTRQVWTLEF